MDGIERRFGLGASQHRDEVTEYNSLPGGDRSKRFGWCACGLYWEHGPLDRPSPPFRADYARSNNSAPRTEAAEYD